MTARGSDPSIEAKRSRSVIEQGLTRSLGMKLFGPFARGIGDNGHAGNSGRRFPKVSCCRIVDDAGQALE